MRLILAIVLFCSMLAAGESQGDSTMNDAGKEEKRDDRSLNDLKSVRDASRQMKTFKATFRQVKKFKILSSAIELDGRIFIRRKPFKLAWTVTSPVRYKAIITDDELTQWDEDSGRTKTMEFDDNPMLQVMSKTYQDLLLGDFSRFSRECDIHVDKSNFTVRVTPRGDAAMSQFVSVISFHFVKGFKCVDRVFISEPAGNNTTIDFSDIEMNTPIPDSAWNFQI